MVESKRERSKASKKGWRSRKREGETRTSYRTRIVSGARRVRSRTAKPRLLEMALFGVLGYETAPILRMTGIPDYMYSHNAQFAELKDKAYAYDNNLDSSALVSKILGGAIGADALYKSRKGKVSSTSLNVKLPYAIGAIIDPPAKSSGSSGGSDW